jgi:hypothetical protein
MWESISSLFAIILVITVVNLVILVLTWAMMKRITNQVVQTSIPALVMVAGYLLLMNADPANLILGTYFFVAPMAILIAAGIVPGPADPDTVFTRILIGDFFLSFIVIVVLGFVISSHYLNTPQYYQNMAVSNGITYACVIVFDTVLAMVIFKRMRGKKNGYPVRVREINE